MSEYDDAAHRLARITLACWARVHDVEVPNDLSRWCEGEKVSDELHEAIERYADLYDAATRKGG